jgi:hypothetical protein
MLRSLMHRARGVTLAALALGAAVALACVLLFGRLGHPLFWHDEAETAAFAQRVVRFGYPKVHDGRNTLYSLWAPWRKAGIGIDEASDAYTGSPWLQYYEGALGVALGAGTQDLYARTAWVRLPFALAGAAGLALLFGAIAPALAGGHARRLALAALYAGLCAASVSLFLHLREARHYSLTLLGCAALAWLFLRRHAFDRLGYGRYAVGLCGALLWLFHSFHPAALALGASSVLWLVWRALCRAGAPAARVAWLAREGVPFAAAALLTLPLLGFFDFFQQTQGWVEHFGNASRGIRNAGFVGWTLLRHEFLAPALLLRAVVLWLDRWRPDPEPAAAAARRAIVGWLWLTLCVYALLMLGIPFLFERYFIVLGPLLCAAGLLDLSTLWESAAQPASPPRRGARVGLALGAAALAGCLLVRAPELAGRVHEIRHAYRGPLDYVIPYLAAKHPDPSVLVIATNYEEPAFMFYLGSRVTVGFYAPNLPDDLAVAPDVIVPRPWPDQMGVLRRLASQGRFEPHSFPVGNLRWNNTPSLSARVGSRTGHRFRDPVIDVDGPQLVILERVSELGAADHNEPAGPGAP